MLPVPAFLALGDSYTIGEGVDADARWPMQLAVSLRDAGIDTGEPEIHATTGWTTDELAAAIAAARPAAGRALVSLMIGVNNQYRGRSLADYRDGFTALLEQATAFADGRPGRVVVVSIPDWGVSAFAAAQGVDVAQVAMQIDAFNAAARGLVLARGAHWVDVTAISRGPGRDLLAADGLHPSVAQHALWTAEIAPVARRAWGC